MRCWWWCACAVLLQGAVQALSNVLCADHGLQLCAAWRASARARGPGSSPGQGRHHARRRSCRVCRQLVREGLMMVAAAAATEAHLSLFARASHTPAHPGWRLSRWPRALCFNAMQLRTRRPRVRRTPQRLSASTKSLACGECACSLVWGAWQFRACQDRHSAAFCSRLASCHPPAACLSSPPQARHFQPQQPRRAGVLCVVRVDPGQQAHHGPLSGDESPGAVECSLGLCGRGCVAVTHESLSLR